MTSALWVATAVMAAMALLFVIRPLVAQRSGFPKAGIVAAILVAGIAIGLYSYLGTPEAANSVSSAELQASRMLANAQSPASDTKIDSVGSLLEGLEKRLEREPEDAGGWLLLAKSYRHLGRIDDAHAAYAKAVALGKEDAAFAQFLDVDSAVSSTQTREIAAAPAIRGRVSMDTEIASQFKATATVFVFAKAVNGSPMPLAVVRKPVSELPFEFVLDDSLAMTAGMTISSAEEVVVTAKISTSGNAMQPDAGFEANSGPVSVANAAYLELKIRRQE
jgi:hypothetical protein